MIAPIAISALLVLYCLVYFGVLITALDGLVAVLLGVVPLAAAAGMICVCVQRIREIRGGEEDDLGQY